MSHSLLVRPAEDVAVPLPGGVPHLWRELPGEEEPASLLLKVVNVTLLDRGRALRQANRQILISVRWFKVVSQD